ncbi:terminase B [Clostridium sporogenes]|uniref:phage terminase large subunit n=1 Tax=Clostridium sporogenes TaxID=1509 RepID=UPI00077FFDA0|nr:phage terminase large subunit [Clostridium sporogenes]KYN77166.1 terminase B [Clostridium sporogenes]
MDSSNIFVELLDIYWDNPVAFAEDMLGFHPDEWQSKVMMDIANSSKVSVRSGQGVGKTGLEASIIIWFLCCRPFPKVVATAPTMQQLYDVLWAEVAKWLNKSTVKDFLKWTKTKIYMIGEEERWFATAKTATKPENMQGFHEDYMLFIVDEASGVADPIMEAILGTLSGAENKLLMCGNPNKTSGVFYDSHNRDRAHYRIHKVSSLDSPRTSKENIQMLKDKYHEDSDVYRVRVLGEFPKGELDTFIALEIAELASKNKIIDFDKSVLHIGVDVARFGDDETNISPRIGGKVFKLKSYSKQDTMVTVGYIVDTYKKYMDKYQFLKKCKVKIDDTGVGGGVTDRLKEVVKEQSLKIEVIPVNNGESSSDEHYENKGTECWANLRDILEENFSLHLQGETPVIDLPNDDRLISQLTTRKWKMTSRGKMALERKEDMKKRGLNSPDRADAVVLAFYEGNVHKAKKKKKPKWL